MKTTSLFVELVVVGTGAALFVVLLLFTFFGDQPWLYQGISKSDDVASIIPVLSLIYVLGIVVDKVAYRLFKSTEDHLRRDKFRVVSTESDKLKGYYDARHHLYIRHQIQLRQLKLLSLVAVKYESAEVGLLILF